ncbi:phenylalanine--tRNA ligase subunit alpha, partial [Actinomyces bowdenii]|nr:phenylalanine--tRNA ligase subunit alpha [Actinomyces bowdenii]NYS69205.1 phenylalanine--tRNA ligase subunit alpha [Actinomyces bowdenii]
MTDAHSALSPLDEAGINALIEAALAAIAEAQDLAGLKEARLAYTGDASALALANRAIGGLDKADKPTAGRLLGAARGRIGAALAARQEELEAAAEEQMLATEAVDVTVPTTRTAPGA